MSDRTTSSTVRGVLKPILSDDPLIETEESSAAVFYTEGAQRIAQHIGLIIAGGAGLCLLGAWSISLAGGPKPLEHLLTLLAFAIGGVPALEAAWGTIRKLKLDIDVLMVVGAVLAAYIGNPFEGALLLFLFALSGGLETYALRRTRKAIVALRHLAPTEATLIFGDRTESVALRHVSVDSLVLVKPGEKVPVDGVIEAGSSSVDESAITGEAIPRDCRAGDTVFAGTQNVNGRLEVRVSRLSADTTLAKIVRLVTEARQHPAKAQRLIDRIGPPYTVAVMAGAVIVVLGAVLFGVEVGQAIRRGIAFLIVASPCALIISTPVAYLSAIAGAAKRGVLIKGGGHLELIARAATFAFDKTGTLTTGEVRLADIQFPGEIGETEALRLAGGIEGSSNHPLAAAVSRALIERGLTAPSVSDYQEIPGEGAAGVIEGRSVWIGRPERLDSRTGGRTEPRPLGSGRSSGGTQSEDVGERAELLRKQGKTVSAMVVDSGVAPDPGGERVVVLLAFQDTLREWSAECVEHLRRQGIERIEMLTGDHDLVARRVAGDLKLDGYLAELAPDQKVDAVEALRAKYGGIVLVGDGINDAPALAHADVGIAMGSRGSDVALEAADVVLMNDRLDGVAWLHRHARRTAGIVRQNLTLALAVIAVLSVFAVMGAIPLPLAVIGHEGSTVIVAINALRLLKTPDV